MKKSTEYSHLSAARARVVGPMKVAQDDVMDVYQNLKKLGIGLDEGMIREFAQVYGMDAIQGLITTASINTPVQFLQAWLPGTVHIQTAARKADLLMGYTVAGNFEDEEVIQATLEETVAVQPYGDLTNSPLADYNQNYERRSIVRFEAAAKVGFLEAARAARVRIDAGQEKRNAAQLGLEITRNKVAFYGYNTGQNRTYGYLNETYLPAYQQVAQGATSGSRLWSVKTFLEITADIRTALAYLRTASQDLIDVKRTSITLAVSTNCVDYMSRVSDFGISVTDWLTKAYPNVHVESAPELNSANSSANVFYLYADEVDDGSSDNHRVFDQIVPSKLQVIGVAKTEKGVIEDYANATAGVLLKRPYAVQRWYGI